MSLVQPRTRFTVYMGKIFVAQPAAGFVIEVFDTAGEKLYRIEKNYEKIPIPASLKKEKIEIAKKQAQTAGYWEVVKDKICFPRHFPPIERFVVTAEKIYVKTPKTRGELVEFVKRAVSEGNVRRLVIKDSDDEILLEIPLTAGAVVGGALVIMAPVLAALGAMAALLAQFKVVIEREQIDQEENKDYIEE